MEFLLRAGGRHCSILARDKNRKDHKKLWRKQCSRSLPEKVQSQAVNLETQKQTKWIKMHQSQVNICFQRGLLRWLTEQKNQNFLRSLQNVQHETMNLAITSQRKTAKPFVMALIKREILTSCTVLYTKSCLHDNSCYFSNDRFPLKSLVLKMSAQVSEKKLQQQVCKDFPSFQPMRKWVNINSKLVMFSSQKLFSNSSLLD